MELDITKLDRQKEAANRWRIAGGKGALDLTRRFGKTFTAIEFIINPHLNANSDGKVIVVVPSEIILRQWGDNLKSYCNFNDRVFIYTVNYIQVNNFTDECSLLIVDEIHNFTTPNKKAIVDGTMIQHRYRLALDGTYPYGVQWIEELYPVVDRITEDEAVANKWISPFVEYNFLLELPESDKRKYEKYSKPIAETLIMFAELLPRFTREEGHRIFENEYALVTACHTGFPTVNLYNKNVWITYDKLCNTIAFMKGWHTALDISIPVNNELHEQWSPIAIHNRAKNFIDFVKRRNDLLINNPVKLNVIGDIIYRNMVSTICFNESTKFADIIADYINARFYPVYQAACYHSKIDSRTVIDPTTGDYFKFTTGDRKGQPKILGKDSIKKIVIEGARAGYYKFISTARALDEGVDIPIIEQVICTAGTTNPLTYQQRIARGKTIDTYNPNKVTKIINLVFDDFTNSDGELIKSRDKTKLILRQKQSGSSIRWIKSIDEINFAVSE